MILFRFGFLEYHNSVRTTAPIQVKLLEKQFIWRIIYKPGFASAYLSLILLRIYLAL